MFKRILTIIGLCFIVCVNTNKVNAQIIIEPKINVAAAAVTIFNPSVEIGFKDRWAIQIDYLGAYSKEDFMNSGYPFILNMTLFEGRYYFLNNDHKGLFAGANFGLQNYKMNKNIIPFINHDSSKKTYDWGYGIVLGVGVGYKFLFKERIGLELSLNGGWQRSQHEVHDRQTGNIIYKMNPTGEFLLYKAAVNLSYRFGCK